MERNTESEDMWKKEDGWMDAWRAKRKVLGERDVLSGEERNGNKGKGTKNIGLLL